MAEGVDFSGARPSGLCLAQNGKTFAGRYFGPGGSWKHATRAEVTALTAFGVQIVSLVEGEIRDALGGYAKGVTHAQLAHTTAVTAGMPPDRPMYFAVDWDASTTELARVVDYLAGAASVIGWGRVGVYGGYRTIDYLHARGKGAWWFQTYAWSAGRWHAANYIEQYRNGVTVCGGAVDLCRSKRPDFGQWRPGQISPNPGPAGPGGSNTETPWEFTDLIDGWSGQLGEVGTSIDGAARAIEAL